MSLTNKRCVSFIGDISIPDTLNYIFLKTFHNITTHKSMSLTKSHSFRAEWRGGIKNRCYSIILANKESTFLFYVPLFWRPTDSWQNIRVFSHYIIKGLLLVHCDTMSPISPYQQTGSKETNPDDDAGFIHFKDSLPVNGCRWLRASHPEIQSL